MSNAFASGLNSFASTHLPTITVDMLLHHLKETDIVSAPDNCRRVLRSFESSCINISNREKGISSSQILHICKIDEALEVLESDPHIFVCALSNGRVANDRLDAFSAYSNRLIIARTQDSFMYFMFSIQRFFSSMMLLQSEMEQLSCAHDGLDRLLDTAADALDSFIICYDADGQAMGCSKSREARDAVLREAAKTRFLPHGFRAGSIPNAATHEVNIDGNRFATILMASDESLDKGTLDLFDLVCRYADIACKAIFKDQVKTSNPHHFILSHLVEGKALPQEEIEKWADSIGIPSPSQFKLVLFDTDNLEEGHAPSLSEIANAARTINSGDCLYFMHRNNLCVLCYASEGDSQLSNQKTTEDVMRSVSSPYGIAASASQIFENITDIDLAYRQAAIGRNLRNILDKELFNRASNTDSAYPDAPPLIPFENCVIYYLAGSSEKDERFMQFIFSHTLMQKLNEEDLLNGTNNLEIFWEYLSCERNATAVANKLHLHRNTIVYHIEKLQKRFDIDLSSRDVREKMLLDFKVFFLMQHRSSLNKIFNQPNNS